MEQRKVHFAPGPDSAPSLPPNPGSMVKVKLGAKGPEYTLSKELLCHKSKFFAASFREGNSQTLVLEMEAGVVTQQAFETMMQWLYHGKIALNANSVEQHISRSIDFARLAHMCGITGHEKLVAVRLKSLLTAPQPLDPICKNEDTYLRNTRHLKEEHIARASRLPDEHPVRRVFAMAVVARFLVEDENPKFSNLLKNNTQFACDVLFELKKSLNKTNISQSWRFEDPLSKGNLKNA